MKKKKIEKYWQAPMNGVNTWQHASAPQVMFIFFVKIFCILFQSSLCIILFIMVSIRKRWLQLSESCQMQPEFLLWNPLHWQCSSEWTQGRVADHFFFSLFKGFVWVVFKVRRNVELFVIKNFCPQRWPVSFVEVAPLTVLIWINTRKGRRQRHVLSWALCHKSHQNWSLLFL